MADTIKELYNGTITFGNYVDGKQTIIPASGVNKLVIRDVQTVSSGFITAPKLLVGDTEVATIAKTGETLTGTEIVDLNSAVKIKHLLAPLKLLDLGHTYSSTEASTGMVGGYVPFPFTSASKTAIARVGGMGFSNDPQASWFLNGDFYYFCWDGNSSSQFYKRSGGISGSQSTIYSSSYCPVVFDGVSKFHWVAGYYIYTYDTITNSQTQVYSSVAQSGSTFPALSYAGGWVFWDHYASSNTTRAINVTNGAYETINRSDFSSSTQSTVFHDPVAKTMRIVWGSSGVGNNFLYIDLTYSNLTTPLFSTVAQGNFSISGTALSLRGRPSFNSTQSVVFNESNAYIVDKTMSITSTMNVSGATFQHGPIWNVVNTPTTQQLNTYGPSLSLRVTGIQSTD